MRGGRLGRGRGVLPVPPPCPLSPCPSVPVTSRCPSPPSPPQPWALGAEERAPGSPPFPPPSPTEGAAGAEAAPGCPCLAGSPPGLPLPAGAPRFFWLAVGSAGSRGVVYVCTETFCQREVGRGQRGSFCSVAGRQAVGVLPVSPCFSLPPPPFSSNEAFTRQSAKNTCLKGVCDSKPTDTRISLCLQNCFPELLFAQNLPGDGNAGGFRSLSALLV